LEKLTTARSRRGYSHVATCRGRVMTADGSIMTPSALEVM